MTKFKKISEDRYCEMLDILPPALQLYGRFLVGEPHDHRGPGGSPRFAAFFETSPDAFERAAGSVAEYWEATEPMTVQAFRIVTVAMIRANLEVQP